MTKAESHYLNCQDENCEKAYCTDRREFTARLSRPKKESSKDRDIPKELRCGACGDDIRKPHSCTGETTQTEGHATYPHRLNIYENAQVIGYVALKSIEAAPPCITYRKPRSHGGPSYRAEGGAETAPADARVTYENVLAALELLEVFDKGPGNPNTLVDLARNAAEFKKATRPAGDK